MAINCYKDMDMNKFSESVDAARIKYRMAVKKKYPLFTIAKQVRIDIAKEVTYDNRKV